MKNSIRLLILVGLFSAAAGCAAHGERRPEGIKTPCRFKINMTYVRDTEEANRECRKDVKKMPVISDSLSLLQWEDQLEGCAYWDSVKSRKTEIVAQWTSILHEIKDVIEVFCAPEKK